MERVASIAGMDLLGAQPLTTLLCILSCAAFIFIIRVRTVEARGWCRVCNAPDLWVVRRATRRSKRTAWLAGGALLLGTSVLVLWPLEAKSSPFVVTFSLAALLAALALAWRSRAMLSRMHRCQTCGTEYDPSRAEARREASSTLR